MTTQTIEVEGLPEGWRAVGYRIASNENVIDCGEVIFVTGTTKFPCLIVKKIQPRRIVLEETGEIRKPEIGEYIQNNGNFCKCHKPERWGYEHEIWREVKETDIPLTNEEPKLSFNVAECKRIVNCTAPDVVSRIIEFIKDK